MSVSKNITICFRTSEDLRKSLEAIATEERRSISSTIENILYQFIENQTEFQGVKDDKRRYPRKSVTMPALINAVGSTDQALQAGIVLDLSLGGLQISVPNGCQLDMQEDKDNSRISIIFTLPDHNRPVTMQCVPTRVYPSEQQTIIGATIADTDFQSYRALQNYLVH
jgi:hypothetical protein